MSKGGGSGGRRGKLEKSMTMPEFTSPQKCSPLPAAVVTFDAKGYIHSKKVNNYLIGGTLGEGSFAKVKEAYHELVGEKVAIKIIDKKKALLDPYVSKNFKREAKLLQKLNHPNIIQLFQVIETDNNYYLITELCSGGEVMKYIYKKQHLEEEETRKFVRQIVSAIDHLHRAGIIHRDLKVENLMLDDNMNVKLIDFGLSNEEISVDESGNEIHCKTQCGSPAYAAPELLGQRDYNKAADIWSIGVNMYAMLTGSLPFTVEPFNITALHAKMLQNKMNPIPDRVSDSCRDLLQRMLVANPADRISMEDIFTHPWLNQGLKLPFIPHPYPSNIKSEQINDKIIEHMTEILDIGESIGIKQDLISNKATAQYAVYCLLASRLARYEKEYSTKVTRTHDRRYGSRKKVSRDHGFFDDDESDASSTRTAPAGPVRKTVTSGGVPLRQRKGPTPARGRPVSDDVTNKAFTLPPTYNNPGRRLSDILETDNRRNSMPEVELKKQLEQIQIRERKKDQTTITSRKPVFSPSQKVRISVGTYPQGMSVTPPSFPGNTGFSNHSNPLDNMSPPSDPCDFDISSHTHHGNVMSHTHHGNVMSHTHHGNVTGHTRYTSPAGKRSLPRDLSKLGQTVAWGSNPPSRAGSRQSSLSSIPPLQKGASFSLDSDTDELDFHEVSSPIGLNDGKPSFFVETPPPFPNEDSLPNSTLHLPSIDPKPTKKSPKRRNGTWTMPANGDCTIRTQLQVGAIVSEILRTAHGMNMKSEPQLANSIKCEYNSVTFEIGVRKVSTTSCNLHFEWLSGGSHRQFNEVCGQVLQRVHL